MFRLSSQRRTHRLRSRENIRSRCAKGCGAGRRLGLENLEPRELLTLSAAAQFLMDQAHLGCTSHAASDLNSPIAPIYTDACDGVDYFKGFYAGGAMTLDANDPDAAAGRSSVRATWGTTDTYGWFEFHVAEAAPAPLPAPLIRCGSWQKETGRARESMSKPSSPVYPT